MCHPVSVCWGINSDTLKQSLEIMFQKHIFFFIKISLRSIPKGPINIRPVIKVIGVKCATYHNTALMMHIILRILYTDTLFAVAPWNIFRHISYRIFLLDTPRSVWYMWIFGYKSQGSITQIYFKECVHMLSKGPGRWYVLITSGLDSCCSLKSTALVVELFFRTWLGWTLLTTKSNVVYVR